MKRLVKLPLKLVWRALGPIRRPLLRRFEAWLDRYLALSAQSLAEEANLVLDFAASELGRIQAQVEAIERSLPVGSSNLSLVTADRGEDRFHPIAS